MTKYLFKRVVCDCCKTQLLFLSMLFFLFLASVYILLESGHPSKVGECQLTFCEVLEHPRNTLHGTVPVIVAHDDADEVKHLLPEVESQVGQV